MAEFIEITKIQARMCEKLDCHKCPAAWNSNGYDVCCSDFRLNHPEEFERICIDWAKENPEITNADKLYQIVKEAFGEGVVSRIKTTTTGINNCTYVDCPDAHTDCCDCKYNGFWDKPYIELKEGE